MDSLAVCGVQLVVQDVVNVVQAAFIIVAFFLHFFRKGK
nr:MAG: hypothetical protein [Microviridae sp.]